ncbi:MAG TPA: 4-(cytidine 5'-diphospho)-2-C-methyl-D-erythritol kinase [Candidatus Avacidaminococcus intestinavium]|uniref:4-diphosphocytidyl-2-C-methyl-D-erythritol kinase n=1 Tax=Candidatus Avacidaminococcus intestinavium TaxID=2840684 RepID=A0A9D1MQ91_9FIRM|nr:4-(cytidine 5'-diphospho)-2-C-methyl-D-erythritol kinase [Candidatus Avacidaminococcus intestinavium]
MLEKAYAKINLGLDILGKREDGYHEVAMIMQSIALADEVELVEATTLQVNANTPEVPNGPNNLAYRAAMLMAHKFAKPPNVRISIRKKIFTAAGLAGGSADAAAVLRGLNKLWQLGLSFAELESLASELGSDVPFCVRGGTALATGRGEVVQSLVDLPELVVLVAKPPFAISTAWAYQQFSLNKRGNSPDILALQKAVEQAHLPAVYQNMGNVLETVAFNEFPVLAAIKADLLAAGALVSLMSGSGPTVFGILESEENGLRIANFLKNKYALEVKITKTTRRTI